MTNEEQKAYDLAVDNHARAMDRVAELEREVERLRLNIADYNEHERCYQSEIAALKAQAALAASVPAGCKVVPVELLERAALLLQDSMTPPAGCSDFDDWTEQGNAVAAELSALLASAEGVKDE